MTALDIGLTTAQIQIADMNATSGQGLVLQNATTGAITVGATATGNTVDVSGLNGTKRVVTGVDAGNVSESSYDAINGSQLFKTASALATAICGGAALNADGSITQPSFSVGGNTVHNMGDAITHVDGRLTTNTTNLTTLQTQVNNITTNGVANPNEVAYDSSTHDKLTLTGSNGTCTTLLTKLTAGAVEAGSTDAVTGDQLNTTNANVSALETSVKNFSTMGSSSIGINGTNGANGTNGTSPAAASATGNDAIALGDGASASGDHAIVIGGGGATGTGSGVVVIGRGAGASGTDSVAIGNGA
ncbi:hypothetical protein [Caballeronia sp. 15711]|uniref:hypothetical protein n=1 Tax=Caballeronia sp. 15711 TaxID=3391029 RepID=UPI0039E596FE